MNLIREIPVSGDIDQAFGLGALERKMKNLLVQKVREELGLQPVEFGALSNSVDVDQYTGFTILNLIEEVGDVLGTGLKAVGRQIYQFEPQQ